MTKKRKFVIITGASSGIGLKCAIVLDSIGYNVFATIRNDNDENGLTKKTSENLIPLYLDLRDFDTIEEAYVQIKNTVGDDGLFALINNSAVASAESLESTDIDFAREQFEVNFFGYLKMIQIFLPLIRKGKWRIVNISSSNGLISYPYMGIYSATKYALEALSRALRLELSKWKIPVIVINPERSKSAIWEKSIKVSESQFNKYPDNEITNYYKNTLANFFVEIRKIADSSPEPDAIVKSVVRCLNSKNPKRRYLPDFNAKMLYFMYVLFPEATIDFLIKKQLKLD